MKIFRKKLFVIVSSICVALACVFTLGFKNEIKDIFNINSVIVNNDINNDGIKLAKYNNGSNSLSVVASIDQQVTNRKVTWGLSWKTTNSATVTDYVTISNSTDTLTCTITFKKAFTTQIILTCTSQSNTSVKATATIDYVGRYTEDLISCGAVLGTSTTSANLFKTFTFKNLFDQTISNKFQVNTSGGTLVGVKRYSLNAQASQYTIYLDEDYEYFVTCLAGKESETIIYDAIKSKYPNDFADVLECMEWWDHVGIGASYTLSYNGQTLDTGTIMVRYTMNWNVLEVFADNVTLDDSQIIF